MENTVAGMAGAPVGTGGARFVEAVGWGVGQVKIRAITDTPLKGVLGTGKDKRG